MKTKTATAIVALTTGTFALAAPAFAVGGAGQLDKTYGRGGIVQGSVAGTDMATGGSTILQDDGKKVVVGEGWFGPILLPTAMRYNSDGSPDKTFGRNGTAVVKLAKNQSGEVIAGFRNADGSYLLTVGNKLGASDNAPTRLVTIKLTKNGALDASYGQAGVMPVNLSLPAKSSVQPTGVVRASGGSLLVAASVLRGDTRQSHAAVIKLAASGKADTSFGKGGLAPIVSGIPFGVSSIAVDSLGRIVTAGGVVRDGSPESTTSAVFRMTPTGKIDSSFGHGGMVKTSTGLTNFANSVLVDRSDRILTTGYSIDAKDQRGGIELIRFTTSGTLDRTFARTGIGRYQPTDHDDVGVHASIDRNNRVLVIGNRWQDVPDASALQGNALPRLGQLDSNGVEVLRLTNDGSLDGSFGTKGAVITSPNHGSRAMWIGTQSDGKIVISGFSFSKDLAYQFLTIRYLG